MRLIAHACGPTVFPSNTVLSAREALKNGADMVELDLQFTSDGKLAVFHENDIIDVGWIGVTLLAQFAEKFVQLYTVFLHGIHVDIAFIDKDCGSAVEKPFQ